MKNIIYIYLFVFLYSCQSNNKEKQKKSLERDTLETEVISSLNKKDNIQSDSSNMYPLNGKLPFGSIYLENLDTSYGWDSPKWDSVDLLHSNISGYYLMLDELKVISQPNILKKEYLKLKFREPFIDSLTYSIDSIRYQFENIGPYECYYAQLEGEYPAGLYEEKRLCYESGNLILHNPKTHTAKIINIYAIIQEPYDSEYRYFFIDKNKEIKIFQFEGDDGGITDFYQSFSIKVSDNGDIKIKELKSPIN